MLPCRLRPRVALILLLASVGCTRDAAAPSPTHTLRFGWTEPVGTLEPPNARGLADQQLLRLLYEGLTRGSSVGGLEPALAERWESTDGRRWTFHLAPGRTFHDGTPVAAHHVVASWTHLARSMPASPVVRQLIPLVGLADVTEGRADSIRGLAILDSLTLRLDLETPVARLPLVLSRPEYLVKSPTSHADQPVGSGMWRWASGMPGDSVLRLVRADDRAPTGIDTLELRVTPATAVATALREGRIDCVDQVVPTVRSELALVSDVALDVTPSAGIARLVLRRSHPAFADVRVRQALAHALDLDGIARGLVEAEVIVSGSRVPLLLAPETAARPARRYDPQRARQLLAEAGVDTLTIRLSRLPYAFAGDTSRDFLASVRDYWQALGLTVELVTPPDFWRGLIDGTVDVQPQYVFPSFPDAVEFMINLYRPSGARPEVLLDEAGAGATYRALLDEARRTMDSTTRALRLQAADSLLEAAAPDVMLWQVPLVSARRRTVPSCAVGLITERAASVR